MLYHRVRHGDLPDPEPVCQASRNACIDNDLRVIQKDHGLRAQCREHLPYAASRHHRAPAAQDAFREGDPADCLLRAVGHVGDQLLHLDLHGAYDAEISFVFFRIRHVIYLLSVLICSHYTRFSAGCQGVAAVLLPVLFPARGLTFFVARLPCL